MPDTIIDGKGTGVPAQVTSDHRIKTDTIRELVSSERSRAGELWGLGTGNLTLSASMSLGSVLWFKNISADEDWYVQKIIFGWNGGSTNFNRTVFSLIHYNTPEPSANNTAIDATIENISQSGTDSGVTKPSFSGHKWDGASTGMTVAAGGFAQIPNRIAQGNTSVSIDGEIILGPSNSMEFRVTPEEAGEFNVSVVFYKVKANKERGD